MKAISDTGALRSVLARVRAGAGSSEGSGVTRKRFGTKGRLAGLGALLAVLAVGGLVGAAGTGHAATGFTVDLKPLIGTTNVNEIPQVTFGGKIGYHLFIENTGDSNTQHVSIVVTSDLATYFDDDSLACVAGSNSKQMVCTPAGGTLAPGATFDVNFRFTAPASGTQVSTTAAITVAAQSVGGKKNQGTTLQSSTPVLTNLSANGAQNDTYLREDESGATGNLTNSHRQNFGVQLPATLFGDPFGLAISIHDELGAICATCLDLHTELTIPAASDVSLLGNPFYNGTDFNPYTWAMSARYPSNFQIDEIVHEDDEGIDHVVPACADLVGGAPTVADPVCWDTFDPGQQAPGNLKLVTASGRALENGKIGFG